MLSNFANLCLYKSFSLLVLTPNSLQTHEAITSTAESQVMCCQWFHSLLILLFLSPSNLLLTLFFFCFYLTKPSQKINAKCCLFIEHYLKELKERKILFSTLSFKSWIYIFLNLMLKNTNIRFFKLYMFLFVVNSLETFNLMKHTCCSSYVVTFLFFIFIFFYITNS